MYRSRIGRRARRISDSKLAPSKLRNCRISDDDVIESEDEVEIGGTTLTNEEVQGLLELLPYKEALIKIAKGEFEIEKVEEPEEDEESADESEEAQEESFEEDEDLAGAEEDEEDDDSDYDEYEDESEEAVEDSAVIDAWSKRLNGNN